MKCDKSVMLLYAVTDRAWLGSETLYQQVERALKGGVTCVQLREKNMSDSDFLSEAIEIGALCRKYEVPFIINDNVAVAIESGADGIHVGQHDMKAMDVRGKIGESMILGVSAQTVQQAVEAEKNGADYIGVGAVFATDTKADACAVSGETLTDISKAVSIPIVAIGGINKNNMAELSGCGIDGVALVSAIFSSSDIEKECHELRTLSQSVIRK